MVIQLRENHHLDWVGHCKSRITNHPPTKNGPFSIAMFNNQKNDLNDVQQDHKDPDPAKPIFNPWGSIAGTFVNYLKLFSYWISIITFEVFKKKLWDMFVKQKWYVTICQLNNWMLWLPDLVGGLEHVIFSHHIGNVIIPTDYIIFFRGVGSTTNQIIINHH